MKKLLLEKVSPNIKIGTLLATDLAFTTLYFGAPIPSPILSTVLLRRIINKDATIGVDLEKFEQRKTNLILVCGISGGYSLGHITTTPVIGFRGGGPTIGTSLAKRYNCNYVNLNYIWKQVCPPNLKEFDGDELSEFYKEVVDFAIKKTKNQETVLEGHPLFLGDFNYCFRVLSQYPCVFLKPSYINEKIRSLTSSYEKKFLVEKITFSKHKNWKKKLLKLKFERCSMPDAVVRIVKTDH